MGSVAQEELPSNLESIVVIRLPLGTDDLYQSAELPGEINFPAAVERMNEVIVKARKKGLAVETFVDSPEAAKKRISLGV